ncbi:MAG TPA: undecaprenyl-diphosphate phosphatase, partial [Acidimicrobiales bacterium]
AMVIGLLQGVTELFPISSLGHSVLVPAVIGGSWHHLVTDQSSAESPYLAFLVGLHFATALALLAYFRAEWARIIRAFFRSLRDRRIEGPDARLAWLLAVATVPAGLTGLAFEHTFRTVFAKPTAAAAFLTVNGLVLLAGERFRRGAGGGHRRLDTLELKEAGVVGVAQVLALLAGISRSGITMVAGLARGLDHEDAARFSFLLATPIILAAGLYKAPDLLGHNGAGIRGQVVAGSLVAAAAAYVSVRFLVRYFETRNLRPFGIYCIVAGATLTVYFGLVA